TTGTFNSIVPGQFVFVPTTNNNNTNGPSRGLDPSAQPDLVTAINNLTTAVNNLAGKVGPQPGSGFNALPPTVPAPMPKKTGSAWPRKKEIEDMFAELERPGAAASSQAVGAVRR